MTTYAFLRQPRWLLFLTLGLVGLVALPLLGMWQLDRYQSSQRTNQLVEARTEAVPVPIELLLQTATRESTPIDDLEWFTVTATGVWDRSGEVLVRNRSQGGRPGYHVVTPLKLAGGDALLVNRGFLPLGTAALRPEVPVPVAGTVVVSGRVRLSQTRGAIGPRDPADGVLSDVNRIDIERLSKQSAYRLQSVYVELEKQQPSDDFGPIPIPARLPSDTSNLAYAIQWFSFTVAGVVTWFVIIRRHAKRVKPKMG